MKRLCGVSGRSKAIMATMAANSLFIGFGAMMGYPSPAIPNLNEHKNPFHINTEEQSWVGSILYLGMAIGGTVCGVLNDLLGRKLTMIVTTLFTIIGFTIVAGSQNVNVMCAGLFIAGVFGGIVTVAAQLYVSEVAPSDIRGFSFSVFNLFFAIGSCLVYVFGAIVPWNWLAVVVSAFFAVPQVAILFFAESPRWLVFTGNKEAAMFSLKWFRGNDANCDDEMRVIEHGIHAMGTGLQVWRDLLRWSNFRHMLLTNYLILVQLFSGGLTMQTFSVTIFESAGIGLDPYLQTIIMGILSIIGSVVCLLVIERIGRWWLLIISCALMAVSMVAIGLFFKVHEVDDFFAVHYLFWLPVVAVSMGSFSLSLGLLPIPWLFACELFPTSVRGVSQTVFNIVNGFISFGSMKIFFIMQATLQNSGTFWLYAAACASGVLVTVVAVPRKVQEIME